MVFGHKHKGRRAGAAVQVFVATADGKVGMAGIQINRDGACRMSQIPDHHGAGVVGLAREVGHVETRAGPVIDLREHDNSHRLVNGRRYRVAFNQPQFMALVEQSAQALGDIQIGGEVADLRHDDFACWAHVERRRQHLEQIQ